VKEEKILKEEHWNSLLTFNQNERREVL